MAAKWVSFFSPKCFLDVFSKRVPHSRSYALVDPISRGLIRRLAAFKNKVGWFGSKRLPKERSIQRSKHTSLPVLPNWHPSELCMLLICQYLFVQLLINLVKLPASTKLLYYSIYFGCYCKKSTSLLMYIVIRLVRMKTISC